MQADVVAIFRSDGRVADSARFVGHFLQMVLAMMLGMAALGMLLRVAGSRDFSTRAPEGYALVMSLAMVAPMVAWMRFRSHTWERTTEMSAAMTVPIVVLVLVCSVGLLPHSWAVSGSHVLMVPAMLGAMLYRRDDYTRPHAAHSRHPGHQVVEVIGRGTAGAESLPGFGEVLAENAGERRPEPVAAGEARVDS